MADTINGSATVFSTGTPSQESRQTHNRVRQTYHWHQLPSSPHTSGKPCQRLAQTISTWNLCQSKESKLGQIQTRGGVRPEKAIIFNGICCCLPTPMTLASGGSPMFPLVVHQPASPSIWPAVQSLRRGLSTNPGATMWCVCGCS